MPQPIVRHIALAHVQGLEPGAAVGEGEDGGVRDGLAASRVEVAELVAVAGEVTQSRVRDARTLGDREVPAAGGQHSPQQRPHHSPEGGAELGQLAQSVVRHVAALGQ